MKSKDEEGDCRETFVDHALKTESLDLASPLGPQSLARARKEQGKRMKKKTPTLDQYDKIEK